MTKRILIFAAFLIGTIGTIQSQEFSKHALGVRFGDNDGFGAEVSYQLGLNSKNRLEFDLGWRDFNYGNAIKTTALYQWVFNLDKGFNWYVGPGGGIAFIDYDNDTIFRDDSDSYFFLAGDVGIEYNFNIPLVVSVDLRPEIGFGDYNDDLDLDIGLGVRYQF
ncbi:outer membrane beta-barrel protein [Aquimarina sediminis]|uniref:outer membrane beta-barrel protein n=1 Tax=Aquimarina sediminis TaxID=2070536 RepID=UPI000CA028E8|nr:outer membrane beta-barrel protein [Aquimarina sediminis]